MKTTVEYIGEAIAAKQACNVVTVNPELIMAARKNGEFKDAIEQADIVTPDGISLVVIGKLTKRRLTERVTGVDLCDELAKQAAVHKWTIYLLGAKPGVAAKAATNLEKKYSGLTIAGASSADPEDTIINDITSTKPNVLLVAYGSPTQELWIKQHQKALGDIVTVGVGGSFDFIAGSAKRAPRFIQKIGLEWLWRLILQPSRWKRMLALPKFAIRALFE
jgi:N-acetylglucosaminyldiphosphoundecaprenol N-acetyl-beta-D-mannosaminyltransferase